MADVVLTDDGRLALNALRRASFLSDVPPARLQELASLSLLVRKRAGDRVVSEGEYGNCVYVVVDGSLTVLVGGSTGGDPTAVARLDRPGQHFGEGAILGRQRRAATVLCDTPCTLVELEKTRLERLDFAVGGTVLGALAQLAQMLALRTFVTSHRFLKSMRPDALDRLVATARVVQFERGEAIFSEGSAPTDAILLKSGIAKLRRLRGPQESVLAYFNSGDVLGLWASGRQSADLVAVGYVEGWSWNLTAFLESMAANPGILECFQVDLGTKPNLDQLKGDGNTLIAFADDFTAAGAQEGLSLLTINLDTCIRCGNCTLACQERHTYARVARTGKKLVRRIDAERAGEHETILLPASCRHCVNPECMIGCPTGAIHRRPGGEVDIRDFCIGCGSCAERCPYGNIQMVDTPGRTVADKFWDRIANKCNLCAGYDEANCVHNCPTGSILRIEPTQFYPELAEVLGATDQAAVGKSTISGRPFWNRVAMPMAAFIVCSYLVALRLLSGGPTYAPGSRAGVLLGGVAFATMLGALALGVRRRIAHRRRQFGSVATWTRVHLALGWVFLVAALSHATVHPGGAFTTTLLVSTIALCGVGVFGWGFQRWIPQRITRLEGDAQVEEMVLRERARVQSRLSGSGSPAAVKLAASVVPTRSELLGSRYDASQARRTLSARTQSMASALGENALAVERLVIDTLRERELTLCQSLYAVRRSWLLLHGGLSALVGLLALIHVVSVWVLTS